MASGISELDASHPMPATDIVQDVMNSCDCTETEALKLLKVTLP